MIANCPYNKESDKPLEVDLLDLEDHRPGHDHLPLQSLLRSEQDSSDFGHGEAGARVIDSYAEVDGADPLVDVGEHEVFDLAVVGGPPALPGKEGVADHHVLLGLAVVVVPAAADGLARLALEDKRSFASKRRLEELGLEEVAFRTPGLGVLCPNLLIRGCPIEGFEVLREERAELGQLADEGGLEINHQFANISFGQRTLSILLHFAQNKKMHKRPQGE